MSNQYENIQRISCLKSGWKQTLIISAPKLWSQDFVLKSIGNTTLDASSENIYFSYLLLFVFIELDFFLFSLSHQILPLVATFRNSIYKRYACVMVQLLIFWLEFYRIAFLNKSDSMASIREIKMHELQNSFHQSCVSHIN